MVPTVATMSSRLFGAQLIVGVTSDRPTSPQLGPATKALTMYATKTTATERKTRSTTRKLAKTTRAQIPAATTGTTIQRGTLKISRAAAAPANSAAMFEPLAMSRTTMAKRVQRIPKSSRIRSPSPCPETAPMRAAISRTTTSMTVVMGRIHRSWSPVWAPRIE